MESTYRKLLENELARGSVRSIISVANHILGDACVHRASDIHLDPAEKGTQVRLRIDGLLSESYVLPADVHTELIARLKILSGLRTDEHFRAHDGRFSFTLPDESPVSFDVRLSIIPTRYGENAVLRILSLQASADTLVGLGLNSSQIEEIEDVIVSLYGFVLIVGPTGSGKTTTLYTLIRSLVKSQRSIVSIEDPVEYVIPGIRQVQVSSQAGMSYAEGLRALLRQDPDIIVIGEIRDSETANLALRAANTGHLVLSTLHANSAQGALPRLEELGVSRERLGTIEPLIIAQRLVRAGTVGRTGVFELFRYA